MLVTGQELIIEGHSAWPFSFRLTSPIGLADG